MRTQFGIIAQAMMGPRGCGRTYGMIAGAPKGATLLARDGQHMRFLLSAAREQGRDDLKVHVPNGHSLAGHGGPVVPDHFTVEGWLMAAEAEIQKQIEEGRALLERATRAEAELERLKQEAAQSAE